MCAQHNVGCFFRPELPGSHTVRVTVSVFLTANQTALGRGGIKVG